MRHFWIPLGLAIAVSCNEGKSPVAPTAIAAPTPPVATPSLPTTVPGVLTIAMPIDASDGASVSYGLAPFGYHGADHAEDGHPGWDVEYRVGGVVRAAAAGTVQSVFPDPFTAGRTTVQLEHIIGTHHYRTVYTNLATVAAGITANQPVAAGQAIGAAGSLSLTIGTTPVTFAMTHFQLDDFEFHRELPNPNAVSPEPFLSTDAKAQFDRVWMSAAFNHELVEPFATNPRELTFPASRTWTRAGGDGPAGVRFTRRTARGSGDYDYALLSESGTVIESGTVVLNSATKPWPTIDLVAATSRRLGIYDILSNEMRFSLANAGSSRAVDLSAASIYRTVR